MSIIVTDAKPFFNDSHVELYAALIEKKSALQQEFETLFKEILDLNENQNKYFSLKDVENALRKQSKTLQREQARSAKKRCNEMKKMYNASVKRYEKHGNMSEKYIYLGQSGIGAHLKKMAEQEIEFAKSLKKKINDQKCDVE